MDLSGDKMRDAVVRRLVGNAYDGGCNTQPNLIMKAGQG